MQASTSEKKYGLPLKICVASLLFVQMTQAFANPSLSGIMAIVKRNKVDCER